MLLLLFTGGALLGAVLGTLISLAFPHNFIPIVASSTIVSGLCLVLFGAADAENLIKGMDPNPEKERLKVQVRLARLRNPSWKGMGKQVVGALACTAVAAALVFIPGATIPHFLSAYMLLTMPGRVLRSVGGRWERVVGEALCSALVLVLGSAYSVSHPELGLGPFLLFVGGWAVMDALFAFRAVKKDDRLMSSREFFENS